MVTMDEPTSQENLSHLLRIPRELRDRIYAEVLEGSNGVWIMQGEKPPGLLLTCRQTREEACSIYYANTFFMTPERCLPWLKSLDAQNRLRVNHIRLLKPMPSSKARMGARARMLMERIPVLRDVRNQLKGIEKHPRLRIEISVAMTNINHVVWVSENGPKNRFMADDWSVEAVKEHPAVGMYISSFFQDTTRGQRKCRQLEWR